MSANTNTQKARAAKTNAKNAPAKASAKKAAATPGNKSPRSLSRPNAGGDRGTIAPHTAPAPAEVAKEGYKHTPLGWIPEDWEVSRFDSVFEFISTNSLSRDNLTYGYEEGSIYNIHYGDIHAQYKNALLDFDVEQNVPIIKDKSETIKHEFLQDGDLIIADASEDYKGVAECVELKNIGHRKVVGGLHTIVARDNSGKSAAGYRTYFFKNKEVSNHMKRIATGISVYSISKGNLSKFLIILPPLPEQTAIANLLSTWDRAITATGTLLVQKEQRKKWLMQQLLTGKKRLKGFEKTTWKKKHLEDCLAYTPREVPKPSSNFFALGIRSHGKGIFHKNDFEPEDLAMDVLYEVKNEDLIVNITFAWEQAIAVASAADDGGLVSHRFPTYIFNRTTAIPGFFKFFILRREFKYLLDLISPGGAGRNRVMSKKDFLKLQVTIPSIEEQTAIAKVLQAVDVELGLLRKKLEQLKELKKGLMQQLLTGKRRLKV